MTDEGRARAAAANLRHGGFSREVIELLAEMRALRAEAARLVAEHAGRQHRKRRCAAATPSTPTDGDPNNGR